MAYAALAETYLYLADFEKVDIAKINYLALKSITLDSSIAEAHSTLGGLACWYEWDWNRAENEYKLAIQNNPNSSSAYINYSYFLYYVKGNPKVARKMIDKAKILDPLSFVAIMRSAQFYLFENNYKKAMLETQKAIDLGGNSLWPAWVNFQSYFRQGENEKAFSELVKGYEKDAKSIKNVKPMKAAYNKDGINGIYQWFINFDLKKDRHLKDGPNTMYNNFRLYWIAQKYAFLGNKNEAINFLEIAYHRKSTLLYRIKYDPYFENLRTEPRFLKILEKMNLGDYN